MLNRRRSVELLHDLGSEGDIDGTRLQPAGERVEEDWLPRSVQRNDLGLLLISGPAVEMAVSPPFPFTGPRGSWCGPRFEPLEELLQARYTVAIVLLRLGAYAVGVARDGELIRSKTGRRYVHGRHRAGGQSQRRFERNREKWVRELFDEACGVAQQRFAEVDQSIDYLALGGDRHVLNQFMKRCPALASLAPRLPRDIPVDRPRRDKLENACEAVWSSHVYRAPRPLPQSRRRPLLAP